MSAAELDDYDAIPYESFPILETSPDRLAFIAGLFGLDAPDPTHARILELGCAAGGNLIPLAWHWPGSECLGIEFAKTQASEGIRRIDRLGLRNVTILQQNLLDLPLEGADFDYILAHGVYSWVPEAVREHLLRICGARLSPRGVAYINFNCLPGGQLREMLRGMLLHQVRDLTTPAARLQRAREFLAFLATPVNPRPSGADWLQQEVTYLRGARDSYLYHEYLEATNHAVFLDSFMESASVAGLQYLADAQLHTLFGDTLGPEAAARLDDLGDLLAEEQHADFLRLRGHRQTLLCRREVPLEREIDLAGILQSPVWSDLQPDRDEHWRNSAGQRFRVRDRTVRRALSTLSARFPAALSLAELQALDPDPARRSAAVPDRTAMEWLNLLVSGGLQGTRIRDPRRAADNRPGFDPLITDLLEQGETRLPTPRHQTLHLDARAAEYCRSLDRPKASGPLESLLLRHGLLPPAAPPA